MMKIEISHSAIIAIGLTNANVDSKVSNDLILFKQFEYMSNELSTHYRVDFVTIGADPTFDFDSALSNIQEAIDPSVAEMDVNPDVGMKAL